jgi:hypothetical protein
MKRILLVAAALAIAAPAAAKDVTLTLNDHQQQALLQLLDRATRDGGLAAANNGTVYFYNLLKGAVDQANAPAPPPAAAPEAPKDQPADNPPN